MNIFERYLSIWVALSTVVGVLVEVPVMLLVVGFVNRTKHWFQTAETVQNSVSA